MLGKLIKYDLKALAKILAPLWGVLLVMGLIFGISIRSNLDGIGNTMIVFSLVVIVAVIVAIFVMNVIIVIQDRKSTRLNSSHSTSSRMPSSA